MGKPRISVTKLLNMLYPIEEKPETMRRHGENAHSIVYEAYREKTCNNIETEVKMELDRGFYILVGKADIVDHCNKWIGEVKTRTQLRVSPRARAQLSAYVAMYRELHNNFYYGVFVVYDWREPEKYAIIKPFYLDMTILSTFDELAKKVVEDGEDRPGENS